jgi:hypothetical protein
MVTSRIEGAHSCLKAFLNGSRNDLLEVVKAIEQLHQVQYTGIRKELASQRDRIPYDVNAKFNKWMEPGINTKIVPKALRLAKQQYELSQSEKYNNNYSQSFEKSMGIPCCYTIKGLLSLDLTVKESHFDQYWLFQKPTPQVPLESNFDPAEPVLTNF